MREEDVLDPTGTPDAEGLRTNLAAALGDLAVRMQAQSDSTVLLHTIVEAAIQLLPSISWAGVAHVRGQSVLTQVPSDEVARSVNDVQTQLGEGPAISALAERRTIVVDDLSNDGRWPRFSTAATGLGVHCLMVFRLFVERETLGALTIYGPAPHFFTEEQVAVGEILAQHAAVALAGAAAREQMNAAVASRDVIGQAKGILMVRDRLTALQAFTALAKASQDTNVKLVDVARFVVEEFERRLSER